MGAIPKATMLPAMSAPDSSDRDHSNSTAIGVKKEPIMAGVKATLEKLTTPITAAMTQP
jgi:hypothetical protein